MDLESTITTVASYIPEELSDVISGAASYIPTNLDYMEVARFMLFFAAGSLVFSFLGRIFLGKRSSLNHSLSSVMGILFIYALTIIIYTFKPWELELLLAPLPFVHFSGEYLIVLPLQSAELTAICTEVVNLVILAFLVNLLDTFMPKGSRIIGWYLVRFFTVVTAMALHLLIRWAADTYLPGFIVTYAPTILLVLLGLMLTLGLVNLVLGVVLTVVNPILGGIYTFFFSNIVGKQLTKAVFTTVILCAVVFLMGYFGYTVICISGAALLAYVPIGAVLLVLWYLIGHVL